VPPTGNGVTELHPAALNGMTSSRRAPRDASPDAERAAARRSAQRRALSWAVTAGVAVGLLYALRPGVVVNGVTSPRVWLVVLILLASSRGLALLVRRTTGRTRLASAASSTLVVTVALLLLLPSFRQRTVEEPFPVAAVEAAGTPAPPAAAPPAAPAAALADAPPSEGPTRPASPPRPAAPRSAAAPLATPMPGATAAAPPATPMAMATAAAPAATPRATATASPAAPASTPKRLSGGRLDGIGHSASGSTSLYEVDGRGVLRFDGVDIEGTPGPYVYLVPRGAREPEAGVLIGPLKAERGSFSYAVPPSVDLAADWTVLLWCRPYDTPIAASDH
jgi:hypothetical protein